MKERDVGGPAFPSSPINDTREPCDYYGITINPKSQAHIGGMTLRDYFAGQALAGLLANSSFEDYRQSIDHLVPEEAQTKAVAEVCGSYADSMLAERIK